MTEAEREWCDAHVAEVWDYLGKNFDPIFEQLDELSAEDLARWNDLSPGSSESMRREAIAFLTERFPAEFGDVCRGAIDATLPDVWSPSYPGGRLLADTTRVWCADNREAVGDAARQLGLATGDIWADQITPTEFFRACTAAAEAQGGIEKREPGDIFVDSARAAGFLQSDKTIILGGLEICSRFDKEGVDRAIETIQGTVLRVIGTPDADDWAAAADIVVGAASVTVCPEYAEEVAGYG